MGSNYLFVIIIIFCKYFLITSKKLPVPELSDLKKSKIIDECQRCKVLVDSYHFWLDKTSRGKFEGGDAAWEEAKLKSYARSEIRFVEIQEGLCSELKKHQDNCYTLNEEAEHLLEKWWFEEDSNSGDLYSWLCIEQLKYCCPKSHYGELCSPCPRDNDNNICTGHGKCDGDGTRKGKGTCQCTKGYIGKLCDKCAINFYQINSDCKACHHACKSCTGEGKNACVECKSGWTHENGECIDINECSHIDTCNANEYCLNLEGTYVCKICAESCKTCVGPSTSNCTSCNIDSILLNGICIDSKLKQSLLIFAWQKVFLCIGVLLFSIFIFRKSKILASLIMIVAAIYIPFTEINQISVLDILLNIA